MVVLDMVLKHIYFLSIICLLKSVFSRVGEPVNVLPAPAPCFFFQPAPAPAPVFFFTGSGSLIVFF